MSTVYILGAGASKAVWGFPVLKGFFADSMQRLGHEEFKELRCFIKDRFGRVEDANLEDVLTDLDNALAGLGGIWYSSESHPQRLRALQARGQLVRLIADTVLTKEKQWEAALREYPCVLGDVTREDTVITFNYDLGIETYGSRKGRESLMWHMADNANGVLCDTRPPNLEFGSKTPAGENLLLKLHGSTNYRVCSYPECTTQLSICDPWRGQADGMCPVCGADLERVIVPPSMLKPFRKYPRLALLWRLAGAALNRAYRIVIWGFSCPMTDHQVISLFRSCRETNQNLSRVDIIDPNGHAVRERLQSFLGDREADFWHVFEDHNAFSDECEMAC